MSRGNQGNAIFTGHPLVKRSVPDSRNLREKGANGVPEYGTLKPMIHEFRDRPFPTMFTPILGIHYKRIEKYKEEHLGLNQA